MMPVVSIGSLGFAGFPGLKIICIPRNVTNIGMGAFLGCTDLTSAWFDGNAPTMGIHVFSNCASGFTVYYLPGAKGFSNPWNGYPTDTNRISDFKFTASGGTVTITEYVGSGGAVVIPSTIYRGR